MFASEKIRREKRSIRFMLDGTKMQKGFKHFKIIDTLEVVNVESLNHSQKGRN